MELQQEETKIRPLVRRRGALGAEMQALHDKFIAPLKASAQRLFNSKDGQELLEALERAFCDSSIPKDATGAVDPNAVLIDVGARRVIDYLRNLAEPKQEGQGR